MRQNGIGVRERTPRYLAMQLWAERYDYNKAATRCGSFIAAFIAAFILFHFTRANGFTDTSDVPGVLFTISVGNFRNIRQLWYVHMLMLPSLSAATHTFSAAVRSGLIRQTPNII